jgi:subtilisin family serine protease
MNEKEYMVVLQAGVDYDQVWNQIENPTADLAYIPDRAVEIADNLSALQRITHYFLTDQEAEKLRLDPRVLGVQIPDNLRDDISVHLDATQVGNFTKTNSSTGDVTNWGLIRSGYPNNSCYGSNTTTSFNYNYSADGTNVDVLIIDSGIQADHPEFQYLGNSTSRVVPYLWDDTVNANTYYTDYNGHGTHVSGTATGKTFGWAKNSNIYAIKYIDAPVNDPDRGFTGRAWSNVANVIVNWINNKPINPVTGVKNPTVINMSFSYSYSANRFNSTIANAVWRGNVYSFPGWGNNIVGTDTLGSIPARASFLDVSVDEMIQAGAVICKSAGNTGLKIDIPSGPDWNNTLNLNWNANGLSFGTVTYMQGASPQGDAGSTTGNACIVVGALDSTPYDATTDTRAFYSTTGPGVDIFAAGSNVMSAWTSLNTSGSAPYFYNASFRQRNILGTSMSTPQVAGIAALYLQINPTATPQQVKNWILNTATPNISANTANVSGSDYGNVNSQWGGNANVAFMPYNSADNFSVSNGITLTNISIVNS